MLPSEKYCGVLPGNLAPSLLLLPSPPRPPDDFVSYPVSFQYHFFSGSSVELASKACMWQKEDLERNKSTVILSCQVHLEKFMAKLLLNFFAKGLPDPTEPLFLTPILPHSASHSWWTFMEWLLCTRHQGTKTKVYQSEFTRLSHTIKWPWNLNSFKQQFISCSFCMTITGHLHFKTQTDRTRRNTC